jgi:hypothetical protein
MEEWRYSCIIFDLDTRRRLVVSFTTLPLNTRGKGPPVPTERVIVGGRVAEPIWALWSIEKSLVSAGN